MSASRTIVGLILAAAFAGLPACVIYDSPATLDLEWDFDGLGCDATGVHTVTVELEAYDSDYYDYFDVDCLSGGVSVTDLTPGAYYLHLDGRGGPQIWHYAADVDLHGGDNQILFHLQPIAGH